jgi:hypothetical protein
MGLLMNHLAVDVNMRVVLDAGDSKLDKEAEEEEVLGVIDLGELRGARIILFLLLDWP